MVPGPPLVLPTEPLSRPPRCVLVNGMAGRIHLSQSKVVRPTRDHPVQTAYHLFRVHQPKPTIRLFANAAANALDTPLAWSGTNVPRSRFGVVVPADAVSEKLERFFGAS